MSAYNWYIKSRLTICGLKKETNGNYSSFNSDYCEDIHEDLYKLVLKRRDPEYIRIS